MSPSALLLQKILISGGLLVSYISFFGIVQLEKYLQGGVIINKQEGNTQYISPPGFLRSSNLFCSLQELNPPEMILNISNNLAIGFLPRHDLTGNGWRHKPELATNLSWSLEELQREIEDNSFSVAELILNHSRPDMLAMFSDDQNSNHE